MSYVASAKNYVRDNYDDVELSLDKICSGLGVSVSYFSSVFKKETGESFIGYLTEYRMKQASRLLLETDEKNYAVARKVGYEDANYFSYVFKKTFGMSPSRYRSENSADGAKEHTGNDHAGLHSGLSHSDAGGQSDPVQ